METHLFRNSQAFIRKFGEKGLRTMRLCTSVSKLVIIEIIIISSHRRQSAIAAVGPDVLLINDKKTSTITTLGASSKILSAFTIMYFVINLYV